MLKEELKFWLAQKGFQAIDCGNKKLDKTDDYADFSLAVAKKVKTKHDSLGIVLCGSGVGVAIVANKVAGIRAGQGFSEAQVAHARANDQINILCLAADHIKFTEAKKLVKSFINTPISDKERHLRRLAKISAYELGEDEAHCRGGCGNCSGDCC